MGLTKKKISPASITALKEALTNIYWTKKELRGFIFLTLKNNSIVSTIDWDNNVKYESVSQLVDRMFKRLDIFEEDLLTLLYEVSNFSDFSHLRKWDDAEKKIERAKDAVKALRQHTIGYFDLIKEKENAALRKADIELKISETKAIKSKLDTLRSDFMEIAICRDTQKRGYMLEVFLNKIFVLFDLDPKAPFKITGEQIDGAFTFQGNDYLLEVRWVKKPVNAGELYKFYGKLAGKLKNILGLFISIDGYSAESIKVDSPAIKSMILMDGADLNSVVEGHISLNELLYIKRRHASETGNIYLQFRDI